MSALDDDELQLEPTGEWNLPTEKDEFLAWLASAGLTLAEFMDLPAWRLAPPDLVASLEIAE